MERIFVILGAVLMAYLISLLFTEDWENTVLGRVVMVILSIVGFCVVVYFIFLAFTSGGGSDICGGGVTSYDC